MENSLLLKRIQRLEKCLQAFPLILIGQAAFKQPISVDEFNSLQVQFAELMEEMKQDVIHEC